MTGEKREVGPELMRIILMLQIIGVHYLSHAGLLPQAGVPLAEGQFVGAILESVCIVCLNGWVLLSGYYMTERSFRFRRLLLFLAEVYFYLLLGYGCMLLTGIMPWEELGGVYGVVQRLLPISGSAYWFMSAYIIVYILSPVLCMGMDRLTRGQARTMLLCLLFFSVLLKSVVPVRFPTDHDGYEAGWFIVLFLLARYLRKFEIRLPQPGLLLAGCFAGIAAGTLGFHALGLRTGHFLDFMNVFYAYNHVFNVAASMAMFQLFRGLKLPEGRLPELIRRVAPSMLGVYLLHEHPAIRDRWLGWIEGLIGRVPAGQPALLLLHFTVSILMVFVVGLAVDQLRGLAERRVA